MMHWGRWAAMACVGMLCLLCTCLVQHSEATAEPEQPIPVTAAMLMQRCTIPAESAAAAADRRVQERYGTETALVQAAQAPAAVQCCDGNGWIITGRTWPRTVYAVCPPEGMPG